ncbi:MAG: Hsp20/alpha crystallin family protein [Gemmatimonadota bacterium]
MSESQEASQGEERSSAENGESSERREAHGWAGWSAPFSGIPDMVSDVVDTALRGLGPVAGSRFPRYDLVRVEREGYTLLMDLPGVEKDALEVTTVGDELTISGVRERPELPESAELLRSERIYGRFRRTIRMPSDADAGGVRAKLEAGVLRVTLPRRGETETQHVEVEG